MIEVAPVVKKHADGFIAALFMFLKGLGHRYKFKAQSREVIQYYCISYHILTLRRSSLGNNSSNECISK